MSRKSTINYVVKAAVVATTKGQGGRSATMSAGSHGAGEASRARWTAMKYEVDYRAVAGDLAKSKVGGQAKRRSRRTARQDRGLRCDDVA